MDSVELPLPANVAVGKLAASEGLDRCGESETKNSSAGKEGQALREGSGHASCLKEYSSLSGSRKVDEDSCVHENLYHHLQCGEESKGYDMKVPDRHIPLSPNHEGKLLGRKYAKKQAGIPSKLPRVLESENYVKNTRTDGHESISNKAGFDPIRCTFADKPQLIEQKRVHEGKKADRKHFRASSKNKYESLTSKAGLVCGDALCSGNNILGTHGLKSDLLDITKNLDDLSIFELLDGSYKYPKLTPDKGKKYSNVNDNVLLSVRKACSILCPPPHGAAESASHIKSLQNSQDRSFSAGSSSDCETKEKNLEESFIKAKADDSGQANWIEPTVVQPKNILDQLTLPAVHELEAFLFNQNITSNPVQCTEKAKSCVSTSLPPFPWSFSHGGNGKPSVEFCKANPTKSLYQGKWVRIGCSSTSTEDDKSFLSGSIFKACGQDVDFINQRKINDVLQDMNSVTSTLHPPSDGLSSKTSVIGTHADVLVPEIMSSSHGSGIPVSFYLKTSTLHEMTNSLRSHPLEWDSKGNISQETAASEVVSVCQGNEMNLDSSKIHIKYKDKAILTERTTGFDDCSASCSCRTMNAGSDCSSWQLSTCEKYRQAYSPELLSAAEVLCEMANSDQKKAAKNSSGRIRWPKVPSMKTMKARKCSLSVDKPENSITASGCNDLITKAGKSSSPSLDKSNRSCMAAGRNGSVTQANMPSTKHRPSSERRTDFIRYVSAKEAAKWSSVPIGAASSPNKLEKDHNQKSPNGNNSFRPLSTQFSSRADKAYENQIRKAPAKAPSVSVEGSPIRDWIRDRNKRL